ncbi:hypothetical protein IMG5_164600 [Ichthyophthirius multifiliis]|uniref:Uncharacterized protein n=1 Tax=Ichthyophthirius multifiliis TaxID=5932 RepID=G0R0G8_ICHMU|nr:hypothetical protein IMG5_164600 [Ichthyophthirius multifiliis]EGR29047.1 hypothetical protein IMG5_164600 [Ichthyophthirius multifiliis]|eukprot:XP_004030283.1 hypothetical protein IMG5_164600 [Ichthyophthirius multifiliis]
MKKFLLIAILYVVTALATVSNKEAFDCIQSLKLPTELEFPFSYGVACNKFHNGLVNQDTLDQPASDENWQACKKGLIDHFTDDEAKQFFAQVDNCLNNGKPSVLYFIEQQLMKRK